MAQRIYKTIRRTSVPDKALSYPQKKTKRSKSKIFSESSDILHLIAKMPEPGEDDSPHNLLIFQYQLLRHSYPDFPEKMLRVLYVREKGNSKFVSDSLKGRGWDCKDRSIVSMLAKESNPHFNIHYFWGEWNEDYRNELNGCLPGVFFTTFKPECESFYVYYVNEDKEICQMEISSPEMIESEQQLFSLTTPLGRPESIPHFKLVPFL
mmetsp:Transcript_26401/g.56349  ORF Transcript_26401/g.56349 Transcript_26401/m.56349 type:complete len:208 (-) Transcript_26401:36-659(-)